MPHHTLAALFATGDELAIGQSRDTNSADLAAALLPLGIRVIEHVVLPDDELALAAALSRLAPRVDLILTTGGLGPTADDLTRPALARALGEDLVEDPEALARLEAFFRHRNREMPPLNRVQALRPRSAGTLPNPHGTAPGLHALLRGGDHTCDVFCLPQPFNGCVGQHPFFNLGSQYGTERMRAHCPRAYGIDPYFVRTVIESQIAGHMVYGRFRRCIGANGGTFVDGGHGRHIDDAPISRVFHVRSDQLAQTPHTENVHLKNFFELCDLDIIRTFLSRTATPNIVDQNVDSAEFLYGHTH